MNVENRMNPVKEPYIFSTVLMAAEATKLSELSMERVASDSASVQAIMRVNAEQAPKNQLQEPT